MKRNMPAVLKIAKSGKDVPSITDERDFVFSSQDFTYLEEIVSGLGDTDSSGDLTITHGMGYKPGYSIFMADYSDQTIWYPHDHCFDSYVTSTNLVITGAMFGIKSKIRYSLFSTEL